MLGEKIQQLRKAKGMSQEQLAAQLTISRQAISKWELGESMPDTDNVIQLSKVLGVTTDFLLNDEINSDMEIPVVMETQKNLEQSYKERTITLISIGFCVLGISILVFAKWPLSTIGIAFCGAAIGLFLGRRFRRIISKLIGRVCPRK